MTPLHIFARNFPRNYNAIIGLWLIGGSGDSLKRYQAAPDRIIHFLLFAPTSIVLCTSPIEFFWWITDANSSNKSCQNNPKLVHLSIPLEKADDLSKHQRLHNPIRNVVHSWLARWCRRSFLRQQKLLCWRGANIFGSLEAVIIWFWFPLKAVRRPEMLIFIDSSLTKCGLIAQIDWDFYRLQNGWSVLITLIQICVANARFQVHHRQSCVAAKSIVISASVMIALATVVVRK